MHTQETHPSLNNDTEGGKWGGSRGPSGCWDLQAASQGVLPLCENGKGPEVEPFQVGTSVMVPPFVPFSNCRDHWQLHSPKGLLVALRADSIWLGISWLGNLLNKGCAAPFDLPMLVLFSGTNTPHSTPLLPTPPRIPRLAPWEKGASFSYSSHLPWAGWLGLGLMPFS